MKRIFLVIAVMILTFQFCSASFAMDNSNAVENRGQELKASLMLVQRLFDLAENSFFSGMSNDQVMEYALILNRVERELVSVLDLLPVSVVNDMQNIQRTISDARFTLLTDGNVAEAHRLVGRASINFGMLCSKLVY